MFEPWRRIASTASTEKMLIATGPLPQSQATTGNSAAATMDAKETVCDNAKTRANANKSARPIRQSNERATANDVQIPLPPRNWK